jgi:hypothetical protein
LVAKAASGLLTGVRVSPDGAFAPFERGARRKRSSGRARLRTGGRKQREAGESSGDATAPEDAEAVRRLSPIAALSARRLRVVVETPTPDAPRCHHSLCRLSSRSGARASGARGAAASVAAARAASVAAARAATVAAAMPRERRRSPRGDATARVARRHRAAD